MKLNSISAEMCATIPISKPDNEKLRLTNKVTGAGILIGVMSNYK